MSVTVYYYFWLKIISKFQSQIYFCLYSKYADISTHLVGFSQLLKEICSILHHICQYLPLSHKFSFFGGGEGGGGGGGGVEFTACIISSTFDQILDILCRNLAVKIS